MALKAKVNESKQYSVSWSLGANPGSIEGLPSWSMVPAENGILEPFEDGSVRVTFSKAGDVELTAVGDNIKGEQVGALKVSAVITAEDVVLTADSGQINELVAQL